MEQEVRRGELGYLHLSPEQLTGIGTVIHRAAELDAILARLCIHLAIRNGCEDTYDALYTAIAGELGIIRRLRPEVAKLPTREQAALTALLDECFDLFDLRNGIAHGVPRLDESGTPYMWRKRRPTRTILDLPPDHQHEGVVIESADLTRVAERLAAAFDQAWAACVYYWPPALGPAPRGVRLRTMVVGPDGGLTPAEEGSPPQV